MITQSRAPVISIVINCYDGERFLREALDSVLCQTYRDWELVFWDNQSTDRSAKIVKEIKDPRIRYFLAPFHTPLGAARRAAVRQCRGEYLSFLDSDDVYLPNNLQVKLEEIRSKSGDVAYGGVHYITIKGRVTRSFIPKYRTGRLFGNMLRQFGVDIPTLFLRRQALLDSALNFDDEIVGSEEYDLIMQLAVDRDIVVIPKIIAKVRQHRGSLTYKVMEYWHKDRMRTLEKIRRRHPDAVAAHQSAFDVAYSRALYYRARWLVNEGVYYGALQDLRRIRHIDRRYLVLYWLLWFSPRLWNMAHEFAPSSRRF